MSFTTLDIEKVLHQAIGEEIKKHVDVEVEKAKDSVEKAIREAMASVALKVFRNYSVITGEKEIIIRVSNQVNL